MFCWNPADSTSRVRSAMTAPGPSTTDDAAMKAAAAQQVARGRPTRDTDTLLVLDRWRVPVENLVKPFSSTVLKEKMLVNLIAEAPPATSKFQGAKKVERAVMMQDSCLVTECAGPEGNLTDMLPGGVAIIDHLVAWCNMTPGWNSLLPIINQLRSKRTPSLSPSYHPEIFELAIGCDPEERFSMAASWVRRKQEETRAKYGFFLPAAVETRLFLPKG